MSDRLDPMPDQPDARSTWKGGQPRCGACGGVLQNQEQLRCPYVGCRAWLKCTSDPIEAKPKKEHA